MNNLGESRVYAIISLLDETSDAIVQGLWQELETACGLRAIKVFPIPHFTWEGAGFFDIEQVEAELEGIARGSVPLVVQAGGLGIFSGLSPVIYIPLVTTPALLRFHQDIWNAIRPLAQTPNLLYAPETWVPHISLALLDVTRENIACAVEQLAFRSLNLTVQVNNLTLVYPIGDQAEQRYRSFAFKGENCQ